MAGIAGELSRNEFELKRMASERRGKYGEVSVWNRQVGSREGLWL